jgi:hypothetical protein
MTTDLNTAADIRHPRPAATFLGSLAEVYQDLFQQAELFHSNQVADGVSGQPITFLATMREEFAATAETLRNAQQRAHEHCDHIAATVGSDESLLGTQDGGYADTTQL